MKRRKRVSEDRPLTPPRNLREPWRAFTAAVGARLAAGARAYGDASLRATPRALAGEVEQELLDVAGWGFLLWLRLRGLRRAFPWKRRAVRARGIVRGRR